MLNDINPPCTHARTHGYTRCSIHSLKLEIILITGLVYERVLGVSFRGGAARDAPVHTAVHLTSLLAARQQHKKTKKK